MKQNPRLTQTRPNMNESINIKAVVQCAESKGWSVHVDGTQKENTVIFDFYKFTPAGQDFSFTAIMQDDDFQSLIEDVENFYNAYDPDEEAYIWLDHSGHGRNGAPYHMRDVLDDMEAAERMVGELLEALQEINASV